MKFTLKNYKINKAISYYRKTSLFFIFNIPNTNTKNWLKIEQDFCNQNLKYHKIYNTLLMKVVKKSTFKKMNLIINSFTCFVCFKDNINELMLPKTTKTNSFATFLGLRLNQRLYSLSQLSNVLTFNYTENVNVFNKLMKRTVKFPYCKLNK